MVSSDLLERLKNLEGLREGLLRGSEGSGNRGEKQCVFRENEGNTRILDVFLSSSEFLRYNADRGGEFFRFLTVCFGRSL